MLFNSHEFIFFFLPLVVIVYFQGMELLRGSPRFPNFVLLAASYAFYGWKAPEYCLLLLGVTVLSYAGGAVVHRVDGKRARFACFGVVATVLLAILGFFKYYGFFSGVLNDTFSAGLPALNILLPIGISFYTFMALSYVLDVYWKRIKPAESLVEYALFISLFPHLVAGPIIRYSQIAAELKSRVHSVSKATRGIQLFAFGLAKKVLLADTMALVVDSYFGTPLEGALPAWTAMSAYSFQIYFDFSAYSDMAIGLGLVFGFEFPQNFNSPYQATGPKDFWARWHMTLSTWIRDYMFLPWGHFFRSNAGRLFVLFICMVLCGLWHGASFTFIAWGAYHGALLVGERLLEKVVGIKRMQSIPRALSIAATFALVTIGWVFFRSQSFEQAGRVLENMFLMHGAGNILQLCQPALLLMVAICAMIVWGLRTNTYRQEWRPVWWRVALVLLLFVVGTLGIFVTRETPFLYFQF